MLFFDFINSQFLTPSLLYVDNRKMYKRTNFSRKVFYFFPPKLVGYQIFGNNQGIFLLEKHSIYLFLSFQRYAVHVKLMIKFLINVSKRPKNNVTLV